MSVDAATLRAARRFLARVEQMPMTADSFKTSVTPDQAAWAVIPAGAFLEAAEAMIAKP